MNKKITILICFSIAIVLVIGLNTAFAADNNDSMDSSNWTTKNVTGVIFKIPPEFEGGRETSSSYIKDLYITFSISSLEDEDDLIEDYGYEATNSNLINKTEKKIAGHDTVVLQIYEKYYDTNSSFIYFPINKTIYRIAFNGTKITPEIKEIIANTPKSEMTKTELRKTLNQAEDDYIEKEMLQDLVDEAYEEAYYNSQRYEESKSNNNNYNDFSSYYYYYY